MFVLPIVYLSVKRLLIWHEGYCIPYASENYLKFVLHTSHSAHETIGG